MAPHNRTETTPSLELVRQLATQGYRIFSTDQARQFADKAGVSESYLHQALHHLAQSGWIVRLRKGLYSISSATPGITPAHEFEIAMALVSPAAISHWSAMHHHGLTDQIPQKIFVQTTTGTSIPQSRGKRAKQDIDGYRVNNNIYKFVRIKPERFFGTQRVWIGEARVTITDPERTLLDGLMMPQYCGDFAEVLNAFEVLGNRLDLKRIIDYALRLDTATAKRLGWVLQRQGIDHVRLEPLLNVPVKGYRILDASGPHKGSCDSRWMIQENLPGRITL